MKKNNQQTTTHSIVTYVEGGTFENQTFVVRIYDRYHHYNNSQVIKDFLQVLGSIKTKYPFPVLTEIHEYDDAYEEDTHIGDLIDVSFLIQLKNLSLVERLKLIRRCNKFVKESES